MTEDNNYVSLNEFLDYLRLEKGSSEKTIQSYRKDLTIFFEKINKKFSN